MVVAGELINDAVIRLLGSNSRISGRLTLITKFMEIGERTGPRRSA